MAKLLTSYKSKIFPGIKFPIDILEQLFYNIDIKQMFVTLFDT